jgi:hypothetical protein
MTDPLTHTGRLSLERARALVNRRQAVGYVVVADLVATIDALVSRLERDARRRRKPATPPTIKNSQEHR